MEHWLKEITKFRTLKNIQHKLLRKLIGVIFSMANTYNSVHSSTIPVLIKKLHCYYYLMLLKIKVIVLNRVGAATFNPCFSTILFLKH